MEGKKETIIDVEDIFRVCIGCRTRGDDEKENKRACLVTIPILSPTQQCPCLTCLIKAICVSGCEDFREYSKIVTRSLYNE